MKRNNSNVDGSCNQKIKSTTKNNFELKQSSFRCSYVKCNYCYFLKLIIALILFQDSSMFVMKRLLFSSFHRFHQTNGALLFFVHGGFIVPKYTHTNSLYINQKIKNRKFHTQSYWQTISTISKTTTSSSSKTTSLASSLSKGKTRATTTKATTNSKQPKTTTTSPNNEKFEKEHKIPTTSTATTTATTIIHDLSIKELEQSWKTLPELNPTLTFPTWIVPAQSIQHVITKVQPYLINADLQDTKNSILPHIHPRIQMVRKYNDTHKLLLLQKGNWKHYNTADDDATDKSNHDGDKEMMLPQDISDLLKEHSVIIDGPEFTLDVSYKQLSFPYIISKLIPSSLSASSPSSSSSSSSSSSISQPSYPTAYEQIGTIAHFNLKPQYMPFGKIIGQVLVEINPTIETVVTKIGEVSGPYRTYDYEVLATSTEQVKNNDNLSLLGSLETTLVEHGIKVRLDVAKCYWSSRLSGERKELLQQEIKPNQVIADVFCGVGSFCLLAAKTKNCKIWANDWNPTAIDYFKKNIDSNGVPSTLFHLSCRDGYDFLVDLGLTNSQRKDNENQSESTGNEQKTEGNNSTTNIDNHQSNKNVKSKIFKNNAGAKIMPDHIVMNFPLDAPKFLGALRWWNPNKLRKFQQNNNPKHKKNKQGNGSITPRFHVYTFARSDSNNNNNKNAINNGPTEEDLAVDQVANELLPPFGFTTNDNVVMTEDDGTNAPYESRRNELNKLYNCNVSTRVVRDVAPGKVVVCVSFSITPRLIHHMQGDYR